MREDETVDLMNDEVRIYLTSSQEVFQQDDAGSGDFAQRVGHRSQLVIDTNVASIGAGACINAATCTPTPYSLPGSKLNGPVPYKYVAYSTVNPTQPSPQFNDGVADRYQVVCPVCTHAAYCTQTAYDSSNIPGTTIAGTIFTPDDSFTEESFDGCTKITYNGYAPMYDKCASHEEVYSGYSYPRIAGAYIPAQCRDTGGGATILAVSQQHCTGYTTHSWLASRCKSVDVATAGAPANLVFADDQAECETAADGTPTGNTWAEDCLTAADSTGTGTGITVAGSCTSTDVWQPWADPSAGTWDTEGCFKADGTLIDATVAGFTSCTTQAGCEGTVATNKEYVPPRCLLTVTQKDGSTKEVNWDHEEVLTNGQVDRAKCEAAATAAVVGPLPGRKGAASQGAGKKVFTGGCLPTFDVSAYAAPLGGTGAGTESDSACSKDLYSYDDTLGAEAWTILSPQPAALDLGSSMSCFPAVTSFDGVTDIMTKVAMGGEDPAWLTHEECWDKFTGEWKECANSDCNGQGGLCKVTDACEGQACLPLRYAATADMISGANSGFSDLRIRSDGSSVLRDIPRVDDYCRYCDKPGLKCDINGVTGWECVKDTINGGDTAPNQANWLYASPTSGPTWRGDLSSGAQLVFDSTNWQTAQTVIVTARDDHIYEPNVFGRGQDAFVHHYVVAQDINLQHTYYENIDVNDVVVSVTDNDPAVVLQKAPANIPTEAVDYHGSSSYVALRLASEPMYDVTVYLQSGPFFSNAAPSSANHMLPDDEQVIFQDKAQYDVCFDATSGLRTVSISSPGGKQQQDNDCTANADVIRAGAGKVHSCDPDGIYAGPESFKDVKSAAHVRTTDVTAYEMPTGWICTGLENQADCEQEDNIIAAGCKWVPEPFEWVPCSCVGYDNDGDGTTDPLPHDGTAYPICLDAILIGEITATTRTGGSGTTTTGIDQAHCERVGLAFSDDSECTEGCNTWWNGACVAADGSALPGRTNKDSCIMTGNVWEGKSCEEAILNDMVAAAVEDDCTTVRTGAYWEAAYTCTGGTDPEDCGTRAGGTCDEQNCEFIANVWTEVPCVDDTGTPAPAPAANQGSQQECEGLATGLTWGTTCSDENFGWTTEEECTGLTGFTWRGNDAGNGVTYTSTAGPLGTCDDAALTGLMVQADCDGTDSVGTAFRTGPALATLSQSTGSTFHYAGNCYEFGASGQDIGPLIVASTDTTLAACDDSLDPTDSTNVADATVCEFSCTISLGTAVGAFSLTTTAGSVVASSDKGFCKNSVNGMIETALDSQQLCETTAAYDSGDAANSAKGTGSGAEVRGSCQSVAEAVNTKSMDMVCGAIASPATNCEVAEGCEYRGSTCVAEDLGYDCNSYLVFTSTTWNTWQTVKTVAVADDEDETLAKPAGTDTSQVGYLYTSRDWYYNSPGSSLLDATKTDFTPAAPWSTGTPDGAVTVQLSMFDTRFGSHINRYPWTASSTDTELADSTLTGIVDCSASAGSATSAQLDKAYDENGISTWTDPNAGASMAMKDVTTIGGHVDEPAGYVDEPKINCLVKPPQTVDAVNKVCTDTNGNSDPDITSTAGFSGQVTTFSPAMLVETSCGAESQVVDANTRQVTISRSSCQATEGRRWYHKEFDNQLNPTDVEWTGHIRGEQRVVKGIDLPTTLGLFTTGADLSASTVLEGLLDATKTTAPLDLWTAEYVLHSEVGDFSLADTKMSMPVCPFTVVLEASPLEVRAPHNMDYTPKRWP